MFEAPLSLNGEANDGPCRSTLKDSRAGLICTCRIGQLVIRGAFATAIRPDIVTQGELHERQGRIDCWPAPP